MFAETIGPCLSMGVHVLGVVVLSVIMIFLHDYFVTTRDFKVDKIKIEGAGRVSEKEIIEIAGIQKGENIFSINISWIDEKLDANPWIVDAEVTREMPSTVLICVREHEPAAIVDLGRKFLLNTKGEIFKEWEPADPLNLPIISGLDYSDIHIAGETRSRYFDAVMEVLRLGEQPDSIIPNRYIREILIDRDLGITLYAFDKIRAIKLGFDNYSAKYERLKDIFKFIENERMFSKIDSIDMNDIDRIVVNPDYVELNA